MTTNRRSFRRISVKTVIATTGITTPSGEKIKKSYTLQLEDLSAGGLRYRSRFRMPIGTRIDVAFELADLKLRATAEVVRIGLTDRGDYDIGCKFVAINSLTQENLARFVTRSSVRAAQPSAFYTLKKEPDPALQPLSCTDCRCASCGFKDTCRACYKRRCGKRFCRLYVPGQSDMRRRP